MMKSTTMWMLITTAYLNSIPILNHGDGKAKSNKPHNDFAYAASSKISNSIEPTSNTGTIVIEVTGFKKNKGILQISLFNSSKGFPNVGELTYKSFRIKVSEGKNDLSIPNLPYGSYAISVHHDENENGELDTNFFGIPIESLGASNNPNGNSMPSFKDAEFEFNTQHLLIPITLK